MDKVFNVEIDGQITLPDGRKLGPFEETTVNVVQPSEGSSDPILSNAKQTGGIGYTEQGEQTVITWDGDTEGKTVVADSFCKVADSYFNNEEVVGMYITLSTGQSITVTQEMYDSLIEYGQIAEDFAFLGDNGEVVCVRKPNIDVFDYHFDETGIYFIYADGFGHTSSLTYGTPDTIHKIDEKYLPASGGDFIIHVTEDDDGNLVADKTYKEVFEARNNGMAVKAIYRWAVYPINSYYNSGGFSGQFIPIDVAGNLMYVFTLKFGFDDNDNPQITHNQTSYTLTAST